MWFVTWDRPEYREWARADAGGYELVILCVEADGSHLCVKARLNRLAKGMPQFVTESEERLSTMPLAQARIDGWMAGEP
jgi:hypothetical protein